MLTSLESHEGIAETHLRWRLDIAQEDRQRGLVGELEHQADVPGFGLVAGMDEVLAHDRLGMHRVEGLTMECLLDGLSGALRAS